MTTKRGFSPIDRMIIGFGETLNTLFATPRASRPLPTNSADVELSTEERKKSAAYMRVNHVGEVCAQALYQSQALTASEPSVREQMRQAANEEVDHLAWCEQRLDELGARKSLLNPLWYSGAFAIGTIAGIAGDKWNLGFVAETEKQVVDHLESHLSSLPENDTRSREVVAQMKLDEAAHAEMAKNAGAAPLPEPVSKLMRLSSEVMTRTAHWI